MREPWLGGQALGFKGLDLVGLAQGQADVVKAVEQAVLAEGLHLERDLLALGSQDNLALQVYGRLGTHLYWIEQDGWLLVSGVPQPLTGGRLARKP